MMRFKVDFFSSFQPQPFASRRNSPSITVRLLSSLLLAIGALSVTSLHGASLDRAVQVEVEVWDGDYDEIISSVSFNGTPLSLRPASSVTRKFRGDQLFTVMPKLYDIYPIEWELSPKKTRAFWEKNRPLFFSRSLSPTQEDGYIRIIIRGSKIEMVHGPAPFSEIEQDRNAPPAYSR